MWHWLYDDPRRFFLPGLAVGLLMLLLFRWAARAGRLSEIRVASALLLGLWFAFIFGASLIGPPNLAVRIPRGHFNLIPFGTLLATPGPSLFEVVGNVAEFVPLGVLLPLSSHRLTLGWTLLVGFSTAVAIEVSQYVFYSGRTPTIDDAILNSVGTALGWATWWLIGLLDEGRRDGAEDLRHHDGLD
jgi:glycopeptide antibiotics resistance protein